MSIVAYYCNQGPLLIKQKIPIWYVYVLKKLGDQNTFSIKYKRIDL